MNRARSSLLTLLTSAAALIAATPAAATTEPAEPAETADSAETGTRTVEGAYGPVEIPVDPQRIVVDLVALDYLTTLGYDTSNVVAVFGAGFFADDHYLADVLQRDDLVDPGFAYEANLEAIAALDPDLVVAPFDQIDRAPGLDELRDLAPVLVVPTTETRDPVVRYGGKASFQDWRTTLRTFGELLDRSDVAEEYIAETEGQLAALREEHGALIDSISATEIKSAADGVSVNMLASALDSGVLGTILMSELGFTPPEALAAVDADEYGGLEISDENLMLIDSDLLFVEVREGSTRHSDSLLWDTLQVVQDDAVFEVGNHWEYGGALAAREVIADIDAALDELASRA